MKQQNLRPWAAVVVAAGKSRRLGTARPKPFLKLDAKRTVLDFSLASLYAVPGLRFVVVVADKSFWKEALGSLERAGLAGTVTEGGKEREDSVYRGLQALPSGFDLVLIQDAARPFTPPGLVRCVLEDTARYGAVVPGVAVKDTIKLTDGLGGVVRTLERGRLAAIQTPQGFKTELLRKAFQKIGRKRSGLTDDGAVAEAAGFKVRVVPGDPLNFKITTPEDFARARELAGTLRKRSW